MASENKTAQIPPVPWDSFVAIGDSFTEGMTDTLDESSNDPIYIGWADRLAFELSQRRISDGKQPLKYANLAIRGRLIKQIYREQFAAALAMKPDLISIIAGGNDLIRPGCSPDQITSLLEKMVMQARAQGVEVLLCANYDPKHSPLLGLSRMAIAVFNSNLWAIARRYNCYVMDLWGLRSLRDTSLWAPDHLHLTNQGHKIVMNAALQGLGQPVVDSDYQKPALANKDRYRAAENLVWAREHLWPWVKRHSQGRSSGDGRTPKYPQLIAVTENFLP